MMFDTGSMIKNLKLNSIEDEIKQVHKIYLQRGFKITHKNSDKYFEPVQVDMADLVIPLNFVPKK